MSVRSIVLSVLASAAMQMLQPAWAGIQNGDFENSLVGWTSNSPGIVISPWIGGYESTSCVEIGGGNLPNNILSQTFSIAPGSHRLNFVWLALGDAGRTGAVRVQLTTPAGATLASETYFEPAQQIPVTFREKSILFEVPEGVTDVQLAIYDLSPGGGVAVDPCLDKFEIFEAVDPWISKQPSSATITVGSAHSFTVEAVGSNPLEFQWKLNGAAIAGATSSEYSILNATPVHAGSYSVVVSSPNGFLTSSNAYLNVMQFGPSGAGLIAWWPADNDADDVVGGHHGTMVGDAGFTVGRFHQAFAFDGSNDVISFGNTIGNFGTNDFSVAFWLKTSSSRFESVIGKRGICDSASMLDIRIGDGVGNGKLVAELDNSKGTDRNVLFSTKAINDGIFHHIVLTRCGTTAKLYIDSELDVERSTTGITVIDNVVDFVAGKSACLNIDGTRLFTGALDDLRIYNRALGTGDIQSLYNFEGSADSRPPVIVLQPRNQRRNQGNSATFKITAVGTQPLNYQWQLAGVNIEGATDDTLVTTDMQQTNGFRCVVTNPFGSATSTTAYITFNIATGSYSGLYYEEDAVRHESSGLLNFRVARTGSFSATIFSKGLRRPFTGRFTNDIADVNVVQTNGPTIALQLQLRTVNDVEQVQGTAATTDWSAAFVANRVPFTRKNPAPQSGKYTIAMGDEFSEGGPEGTSFGTLTVSPLGQVMISGFLSDDSRPKQSVGLSANGQLPLYTPLYRGTGSVLGWLTFSNKTDSSVEGSVSWIKKGAYGTYFTSGFTNLGLMIASSYLCPTNRSPINVTNATVTLSGDSLNVRSDVKLNPTTAVTVGITNHQILTINPRSGLFVGSIVNPATRLRVPFRGALLQQQTNGIGYFLRTNANGAVHIRSRVE